MIDALIQGRVRGVPAERHGKTGKRFVTARMSVPMADGAYIWASVIAFEPDACATLLALGDGDTASIAGTLTIKVWADKDGNPQPAIDMVASRLLTVYSITKKRKSAATSDDFSPAYTNQANATQG